MPNIRDFVTEKGIRILFNPLSSGMRGSTFQKDGKWIIVINEKDPVERQNFTIAHEYCEILLYDDPSLTNDEKHQQANHMASELLLPDDLFRNQLSEPDLHRLKEAFPDMSYEVIARRIPKFISCVVTIFDNMEQTARFGSDSIQFPYYPSSVEVSAVKECYEQNRTVIIEEPPVEVKCYALKEISNIRRVICITEIDQFA